MKSIYDLSFNDNYAILKNDYSYILTFKNN